MKKIVVIGPESTGKSTLTAGLAQYFRTPFVPEYARPYLEQLGRPYHYQDLLAIARGQLEAEEAEEKLAGNGLLFCDTDLYVMKVWSEHSYNTCATWILEQIAQRHYDYYLLTDIDMPWCDDPLREHPRPEMRRYFFRVYQDIVQNSGRPWTLLSGSPASRLEKARSALVSWLGRPAP